MKLIRVEKRNLPCQLTTAEVEKAADDLARVVQDVNSETLRQQEIKAEMKLKLATLERQRDGLALRVIRKEEDRVVGVEIQLVEDGVGGAVVREIRIDTRALVDGPRPATDEEGQMSLMLDDAPGMDNGE